MDDDFDDNDELNDGVALSSHQHSPHVPEQLGNVFRASSAMTIRYVPPVDFLPAVFVEQYADVLMIVDRYAQLYHKFHVGGGQRDPQLIVKDEDTQRSERELLESRIRQLEADVTVRDDTIAALKQQLVAWRTTGRDRTKFDPARLDDTITTNATMNRRRNDDGDVSSSDHSQVPITAPTRDMPAGDDQNHQRRSSPRRERRRQLQPPQRAVQPIVPQFDAMSPPQVPRREQPTPLVPLDASSPTDRPGRSAPPPNNRTVFGSAPPPPGSQRSLPTSIAQPPPPSANRLNSSNNAVAPDLLGLYAPPRQLFGVDPWKQPQQPTSDVIGPGGIPLPDVKDQYVPSSSSLRHPWGDLMQYT
ncbi:Hypothetical protein, putative [Bodo saltans]|uniref:Uncharacterized protein n=1 Tax=Bodo saltans TaxID=75058 RepID=A0A0S4JR62_BODSA|nr:Hypothetical protein, putative [Bodo saltans]|eukprot:CUG92741.1 Hypothetical protein, putative [Bodo saltans]